MLHLLWYRAATEVCGTGQILCCLILFGGKVEDEAYPPYHLAGHGRQTSPLPPASIISIFRDDANLKTATGCRKYWLSTAFFKTFALPTPCRREIVSQPAWANRSCSMTLLTKVLLCLQEIPAPNWFSWPTPSFRFEGHLTYRIICQTTEKYQKIRVISNEHSVLLSRLTKDRLGNQNISIGSGMLDCTPM